jgi:hypothetical protein
MKKVIKWFFIIFGIYFIYLFVFTDLSTNSNEEIINKEDLKLEFDQVGYYKLPDKNNRLRYFTFNVFSNVTLNKDSIPDSVFEKIYQHGSKMMNTSGAITATFYYIEPNYAPDITLLNANTAPDVAHDRKPIASVWIMPNGQINFFKNPGDDLE